MRRSLLGVLVFCGLIAGNGCMPTVSGSAASTASPTSRVPASIAARIDTLLMRAVAHQQLPGVSVAIASRDGTPLYARGYGFRDAGRHDGADQYTVYNVASISKQFTAAGILLLAQDRRLRIDDSLSTYLPALRFSRRISLRMLMNHTSGIPDYYYLAGYAPEMTAGDIAALASAQPPRFPPGTAYEYSNTNYVLLGLVIEKVSGVSYADFVRHRLFQAARMTASRVGEVPGDGPDDAVGYTLENDALVPVRAGPPDLGYGAGAVDATVVDLARWNAALESGRIINASLLHQMLSARSFGPATTVHYGLGLQFRTVDGVREVYHRGRNDGYGGVDVTFPDTGYAIVLLANNEHFAPMLLVDELYALVAGKHVATASGRDDSSGVDPGNQKAARAWLADLAAGNVDRARLSDAAQRRYSPRAVAALSARLRAFGALQRLVFVENDSRYFGSDSTYRAFFANAIAEYRFGVNREGKVWNLALDRED